MGTSPLDNDKLYADAIEADKRDLCASAVVLFERFLLLHPDHSLARFRYAQNLLQIGKVSDAERELSLVKDTPPEKEWLVDLARGEIATSRGNFHAAEIHFRCALEKKPSSTVPWIYLAGALAKQERFKEACTVLENGLNATGDLDEVYLNLGYNRRALGDYAGARQAFLRALEFTADHYKEAEEGLKDLDFLSAPDKSG